MRRRIGLVLALILGAGLASCGGNAPPAPVGAPCESDVNCQSGHCIINQSNKRRCTGPCTTNDNCPPGAPSCESLGSGPPFDWAAGQMWCVLPPGAP
jgi:hypothetical protein